MNTTVDMVDIGVAPQDMNSLSEVEIVWMQRELDNMRCAITQAFNATFRVIGKRLYLVMEYV